MKPGAIAVPLFTLFGPDGVRLRVEDCTPRCWSPTPRRRRSRRASAVRASSSPTTRFLAELARLPSRISTPTRAADDARDLPVHVRHDARAAGGGQAHAPRDRHADGGGALRHRPAAGRSLLLPVVARLGPRPLARHAGAARARHHHRRLCRQVRRRAAAEGAAGPPVHQHLGGRDALPDDAQLGRGADATATPSQKLSFTGEPIDSETRGFVEATFGRPVCSMYGTTEIGVILVNYPGRERLRRQAGLARQADPRRQVEVQDADGAAVRAGRRRRAQGLAARRVDRRPRISAASTRTATSITPAAPTT